VGDTGRQEPDRRRAWLRRAVTRRRAIAFAALALVLAAAPLAVLAAGGRLGSRLDNQAARWTTTSVSTSSTTWRNVPGLTRLPACTLNEVSATLSVTVRGAPVRFRVLIDGVPEAPMKPGPVRFVPNGEESFSFTFVNRTAPFEDDDSHVFGVQWRSPTGSPVTLLRGDLNILYQRGTHNCP
jgi:hypothetical protein